LGVLDAHFSPLEAYLTSSKIYLTRLDGNLWSLDGHLTRLEAYLTSSKTYLTSLNGYFTVQKPT